MAAEEGNIDIVRQLINAQAQVNIQTEVCNTSTVSCTMVSAGLDSFFLLRNRKRGFYVYGMLWACIYYYNITQFDTCLDSNMCYRCLHMEFPSHDNVQDGMTALIIASQNGYDQIFRLLLWQHADIHLCKKVRKFMISVHIVQHINMNPNSQIALLIALMFLIIQHNII